MRKPRVAEENDIRNRNTGLGLRDPLHLRRKKQLYGRRPIRET